MSRARYAAILAFLMCTGTAATVGASPPDPVHSEVPNLITIVGRGAGGVADPLGVFTVIVRDFNNVPRPNREVVLDFSTCPDIRLAADQLDPNVVEDCIARTLGKIGDANGEATFRVLGSAVNHGASPGSIGPSLNVYASGVWLKTVRVAAFDQNGTGVGSDDLSLFLSDYLSGQAFARSDYDGNGALGANDLSRWLTAFLAGGSAESGGAPCP